MLPGHRLYAYLPGGASGGILPASLANVPLDFDTLQPHGCFIGSAAIVTRGWGLLELRPMRMSLEEIFLSLTTEEPAPTAAALEAAHE